MGIFPSRQEFCALARQGNLIPVLRELLSDTETPVSAYAKIADGDHAFLLESVTGGERTARYSFVGANPSVIVRARGGKVFIHENGQVKERSGDPLSALEEVMGRYRPVTPPEAMNLPPFHGGAVGFLGYDTVRFFDRVPITKPDLLDIDEAVFLITDTILCFDHARQRVQIIANAHVEGDPNEAYDAAVRAIEQLTNKLARPMIVAPPAPVAGSEPIVESNQTRQEFERNVTRCKEYIAAGDAFQIVYSQRFKRPLRVDPFHVYRALRAVNPSPYMFLLKLGEIQLVGSSPEVHVRLENGKVSLRPIAGTRPRGKTSEEDRRAQEELLADEKERAEHLMLVDLGRNDVGRVCKHGTVKVDEFMVVERYSHVMHIVSNVIGEIEEGRTAYDLVRATLPAGTVSGAPKIRAMEIINELEPDRRGTYAGCVGYFDYSGNLDSCITIRTALCKDGMAYVQAGGGIVYDSVPAKEYEESVNKSRAVLRAIQLAESGLDFGRLKE